MLDISTSCEDAFQVHPAALDINPDVKQSHDAIQFVLPAQSVFLKHLQNSKCEEKKNDKNIKTAVVRKWNEFAVSINKLCKNVYLVVGR